MPAIVEGIQGPTPHGGAGPFRLDGRRRVEPASIRIALLNNMPDAALEDTERQFVDLLDAASGDLDVRVKLFSLPSVSRGERARQRLSDCYFDIRDLWNGHFDAAIITGTEPRQRDLRQEPYWSDLSQALDWAQENTASAVLSCLAAHAGVLRHDGIERHPLRDKQFGVFGYSPTGEHVLTGGTGDVLHCPQSRWNEVRIGDLTSAGYTILTNSADAGVDIFVKKKRKSLFVHFQGHPEYSPLTLLKEYRRDIRRFLKLERDTYPSLPVGYFDLAATSVLNEFRKCAVTSRSEELMTQFPKALAAVNLRATWQLSARSIYQKWFQYLVSRKSENLAVTATSAERLARSAAAS